MDAHPPPITHQQIMRLTGVLMLLNAPSDVVLNIDATNFITGTLHPKAQHFLEFFSRRDHIRNMGIQINVLPIIDLQSVIRIKQRKAIRHGLKRVTHSRPRRLGHHLKLTICAVDCVASGGFANRLNDLTVIGNTAMHVD